MTPYISIVSGYFNPLHIGHLSMFRGAKEIAPWLVVIVNNDEQQLLKKGKIIVPENDRLEIVSEVRLVSKTLLASDTDSTVCETLRTIHALYPGGQFVFCNGGDRSDPDALPSAETAVCQELGIEMRYGVGGEMKQDSSSRINSMLED